MATDLQLKRLAARVGRLLLARRQRLVCAESCTGGWVAKVLTDIAGSSQWFEEGWVTYSDAAKRRRLGVSAAILARHGAVSQACVRAMAQGALRRSRAQLALAVSGIAGPGGAVLGKPVGTVWFAWAIRPGASIRITTRLAKFTGDRDAIRRKAVQCALRGLLDA
jgi:nicotinamide-nucleotide amidase